MHVPFSNGISGVFGPIFGPFLGQNNPIELPPRPEYVGVWLGCAKIGVVPALINSNLTGKPLLHSINAASAIACVYGTEVANSKRMRGGGLMTESINTAPVSTFPEEIDLPPLDTLPCLCCWGRGWGVRRC